MITSFILFLSSLLTSFQSDVSVEPIPADAPPRTLTGGGHIENGRFVIPAGELIARVTKEKDVWLTVGDNTELLIEGNIRLESNAFSSYEIIRVTGRNVLIHGKGSIIGDRWTHKGQDGEWGMGIGFGGASHAVLRGLTIKDCWGDCVYVGRKSGSILIENCRIDHGRRQGISVTSADSVIIRNCTISNVSGTMPQYGIDVEPNRNCSVNHVLIENVDVKDCEGGIRALVPKDGVGNAFIGTVEIRNCKTSAKSRYPIHFSVCKKGVVENCIVDATNERPSINANYVEDLHVNNNTINLDVQLLSSIKNKAKKMAGKRGYSTIRVANGSDKGVRNNNIIEK